MSIIPDGLARSILVDTLGATTTTITFKVATGGTTTDPVSGNIRPATTDVAIEVVLNSASINEQKQYFPGADTSQIVFTGNIVDTSTNVFPASVRSLSPAVGTCTWEGRSGSIECQIVGNAYAKNMGERFIALFTPR